jgi:tetratricopeptide (TPR) repeat protein
MYNLIKKILLASFSLFVLLQATSAQKTAIYIDADKDYKHAMELLYKEKYAAAQHNFDLVLKRLGSSSQSELRVNSEYFHALCALELFNKDAEYLLSTFIKKNPESIKVKEAYFQLGKFSYRKGAYEKAIEWFNQMDVADLDEKEKNEYNFKKGYCYFKTDKLADAAKLFYEIKDLESEYFAPSNYYYAHVAYTQKNYQTALDGFKKLESDENFGKVVPFYIAQIYYVQGKYDDLLAYAPAILDSSKTKRSEEISRLVGDAYYRKEEYEKAIPYLEKYISNATGNPSREDDYQIAYAYYRTQNYNKAQKLFDGVASEKDQLGQVASYQMADCYVKLDQKMYARNAFKVASEMDFDKEITEDALFNYAKLAYELSFDPFHEAIIAFEQYIEKYPSSTRKDEAYEFLLKVYMTTKNYSAALKALDKIANKDFRIQEAYQINAFNRGVELFNQRKFVESRTYFDMSSKYPIDNSIVAQCKYWKAESFYQTDQYEEAIANFTAFATTPGAANTDVFKEADYNIGYCYFKTKAYSQSGNYFRRYIDSNPKDKRKKNDAYLRTGDCYLVAKNYDQSQSYYQSAVELGIVNTDYALFQKAMLYGYQEKYSEKAVELEKLVKQYPSSSNIVSAKYELGDTYFSLNKLDEAQVYFKDITSNYAGSPYMKKALLKSGLVLYRKEDFNGAIAAFKRVVSDFSKDDVSREALRSLQSLYVDIGKVDEYSQWISTLPNYDISTSTLDSLNYQAAENLYSDGNCEKSAEAFGKYLTKYSNAVFALNANYYKAECDYKAKKFDTALQGYNYVISQAANKFSEPSLLGAATINYTNKNYKAALDNYIGLEKAAEFTPNVLEAQIGQLRCFYYLKDYSSALPFADKVIENKNTPDNILMEAKLFKAKMNFENDEYDKAKIDFQWIVSKSSSAFGAESKYRLAEIAFKQDKFDNCETQIFELVKKYPSYDFWKIKSFLLLSDVYLKRNDNFQAKATLQSIIDNAKDENLLAQAKDKLKAIDDAENLLDQKEIKPMEIEFDGEKSEENLFEGEEIKN